MRSLLLLAIVLAAGCVTNQTTATLPAVTSTASIDAKEVFVDITPGGFAPPAVEINLGDTITWTNRMTTPSWSATGSHPTHTEYPEPGGCIGSKFDACKGLATGEKFSFTFNQAGTWGYHDHLNPIRTGTVIVK